MEGTRFLVIFNVSKKNNVKSLIYTALGFNFTPIVVGLIELVKELRVEDNSFIHFATFPELKTFLDERNIPLIAIEISETSRSVLDQPFTAAIALMPGNEGTGLNSTQRNASDGFIYIPQYGAGTASLNVTVATSIVLSQYNKWSLQGPPLGRDATLSSVSPEATAISGDISSTIPECSALTAQITAEATM